MNKNAISDSDYASKIEKLHEEAQDSRFNNSGFLSIKPTDSVETKYDKARMNALQNIINQLKDYTRLYEANKNDFYVIVPISKVKDDE